MFEHRKLRKAIDHAPDLAVSAVEGTTVRATGVVKLVDKRLVAPATGRIAVIYGIIAADGSAREPTGMQDHTPFTDVEAVPFALEVDGLGTIRIESVFATLVDIPYMPGDGGRAEWAAYAEEKGLAARHPKEAAVQPGHHVTIVGIVARRPVHPGQEAGFRDAATAISLVGDFDHPLLVAPA